MYPDLAPVVAERGAAGLLWGVKYTFLRYVSGLPDGVCEVSSNIHMPGDGIFGFPLASWNGTPPTSFRFAGTVTFRGHRDLLFVQLSELGLDLVDGEWQLTTSQPGEAGDRIVVATSPEHTSDPEADTVRAVPVLAPDGVELFAGNYQVGEPLGEFVLILPKTDQLQSNTDDS